MAGALAAHQKSPWNVLWQQTWAFCSEPAREQQGLGRTCTGLNALAASSVRFSGAGMSDSLLVSQ